MSQKYFTTLTKRGAELLANATALGVQLKLTSMAVGDGNGTIPNPTATQSALVHEVRRAAINSLSIDKNNPNQIIAEQVIPENEGGWFIHEIGLFDDKGNLIAVGNCPPTYKPKLVEGSGRTQVIRMIIIIDNAEAVALKIDPSVVLATRKYVDDLIENHKQPIDYPEATTSLKGIVQLSSSTSSKSEVEAATSLAVKNTYDLATEAKKIAEKNATHVTPGRVVLSSDIGRQDETLAATILAVARVNENAAKKTTTINGKQLNANITLNASDVGALSKNDFKAQLGNPGFEIMPSGLIRQWGTMQLYPIRDYNSVIIGNAKFFTNYYEILLPIAFPHNSDCVNVTLASATFSQQSSMAGNAVTANLSGSPTKLTIAVTSSVLGYTPTVHYEIIGH